MAFSRKVVDAVILVAWTTLPILVPAQGSACKPPYLERGSCMKVHDCRPLQGLVDSAFRTKEPQVVSLLRQYVDSCGFDSKNLRVCCPPSVQELVSRLPSGVMDKLKQCGVRALTDKIHGGETAVLNELPWMALLRGRVGGRDAWHCGGTLIHPRYVLTAGHCVSDPKVPGLSVLGVRLGELNLTSNPDCQLGLCNSVVDVGIEQIVVHPEYNRGCPACHDLALIRLNRAVENLLPQVYPICLPLDPEAAFGANLAALQDSRDIAVIAGWGSVSGDPFNVQLPTVLQKALVPLMRTPFCEALQKRYPDPTSTLCAGGEGPATCKGDSGGPLMIDNRSRTRWYVLGITSKGPSSCGTPNTQTLFSSVHYHLPWILSNLRP
ncbi:CLIP domain-containing serine protease 14D-like [Penaeus japonicus]|uniref:CLIP domain-containing serine protease 14D-like n=1 Tax=Penaeus japonicus TaxID=27405 RepID=UPI001C71700E|nr:CLIP domain-containing serine protease 14D-like [Penaeus japonicus]